VRLGYVVVVAVVTVMCAASALFASGGIYIDDFRVTNNGATVFSDNFDDGSISDWTNTYCVGVDSNTHYSSQYSLHGNGHVTPSPQYSSAIHNLSFTGSGIVEESAMIWMPAVEQQYQYSQGYAGYAQFGLGATDIISVGVQLNGAEPGYHVRLLYLPAHNDLGCEPVRFVSENIVLAPQTWAQLKLRLDPASWTASALLNGQLIGTVPYHPQYLTSFRTVSFYSDLQDAPPTPEPSGVLALLCGATGVVGVIRRRSCSWFGQAAAGHRRCPGKLK
jgi:hypothetical protein